MVTRMPDPRLTTDSASSRGGAPRGVQHGRAGSRRHQPMPQPFETPDLADVAIPGGRDAVIPNQPERDGTGRFTASRARPDGRWVQVKGLSR